MIKISFRRQADISTTGPIDINPIPGLQERNKRNLLDVLQAATPVIAEMAKVKPETWRSMTGLFTALESTFGTGVKAIGQGFLRPASMLQNRFMNTFEGFLAPVMIGLNNIANQVESYALANQTGATIGAGIGYVAGYFLPGAPLLWAMIGGGIGAAFQAGDIQFGSFDPAMGGASGILGRQQDITPAEIFQTAVTEQAIVPITQFPTTAPGGQFNTGLPGLSPRARRMSAFG